MIVSNSLSSGGAERATNTLANELVSSNYDVTQIVLNQSSQDSVKNLAPVIEVKREWKAGFFSTFYRFLKFNFFLILLKPKVLILNCELPELFGAFSIFTGRIIAVEHTNRPWNGRRKTGFIVRWILRARKVNWVKVSSFIQIWPYKHIAATTLENPVIQMKKRNSGENKRIDHLVYIGRVTVQKGADLLPSMAELSKKKLVLFGDGDLLDSLLKESREKSVEVISHGFVEDPWKLIPPNSILIIPSRWEGDGLVVVEAVLGNVPFLLSDIPEFRRFHFLEKNYCYGLDEFVKSIAKYEENLTSLEIPAAIANVLQNSRKPLFIAKQWVELLEERTC